MDETITLTVPRLIDATQYVRMVRDWCKENNITAAFTNVNTEYMIAYSETSDYKVKHTWKIDKKYAILFLLKWS